MKINFRCCAFLLAPCFWNSALAGGPVPKSSDASFVYLEQYPKTELTLRFAVQICKGSAMDVATIAKDFTHYTTLKSAETGKDVSVRIINLYVHGDSACTSSKREAKPFGFTVHTNPDSFTHVYVTMTGGTVLKETITETPTSPGAVK